MTDEGGFLLRSGVTPASAIRDIFRNGRQYGFECATAIVIPSIDFLHNIDANARGSYLV